MKKVLIILFSLSVVSCGNQDIKDYKKNFDKYMANEYDVVCESIEDGYYYVVHMQGCDPCIENSIQHLMAVEDSSLVDKITIIFVGELIKDHLKISLQEVLLLQEKYKFLEDKKQEIFKYQTGFAYPLFVHIKNGKIRMYEEMIYSKFDIIFKKVA